MKKTILILLVIFHSLSISAQTEVTFTVNTANITVGDNGMYLGGGIFNSAILTKCQMITVTVRMK